MRQLTGREQHELCFPTRPQDECSEARSTLQHRGTAGDLVRPGLLLLLLMQTQNQSTVPVLSAQRRSPASDFALAFQTHEHGALFLTDGACPAARQEQSLSHAVRAFNCAAAASPRAKPPPGRPISHLGTACCSSPSSGKYSDLLAVSAQPCFRHHTTGG